MVKNLMLIILTFVFIIEQTPAFCQTAYTLSQLAELANRHSQTIKIAEDDLYIAEQDKVRALSVLIPSATAYSSLTKYKAPESSTPDTLTHGIKFTHSFTLNGKELIAYDMSKNKIESKAFSLESVRSDYMLQVAQAFYNIQSARRTVEIAASDVQRLTTHRDAVKEKLNVGNVAKTDLFRAEAELSKSLTEQVNAENGLIQRKAFLKTLVDIDEDFSLEKENISQLDSMIFDLSQIQSDALKNRTEIREAIKNLEIARKTVRFERSDYWPSVSLEAGYKESDSEYESSGTDVNDDTEALYFQGTLLFTLYDGDLRKAENRQALAGQRKAENALALQKKQIILDSKVSFLEYQTAKSTLQNLQDELRFAQENYNAVQMQFKYGMADTIDMMDANTLLVTAQRRISDANYTYYLSVLKILYTKGELVHFLLARNQP